jgi:DNA-binding NtrC family response regulator
MGSADLSHPSAGARILVVSEEPALNTALACLLASHRPEVNAGSSASMLELIDQRPALRLLIIGDVRPGSGALDLLEAVKRHRPELSVLILSSHPTIDHATESIRRGAEDFVPIPYSEELVQKEVARILEAAELRDRVDSLDRLVANRYGFERVISRSAGMREVFDRANAAARSATPVLIVGETGTGKELIARAIHANGPRAKRPFVPINCAALPRDLVESELFGHRRGAFSSAFADHSGLFAAAHGGSLFLDEIGELPLEVQGKLLRVLQDGEVRPVGGLESRRVDVRIIAASNRGLVEMRNTRMRQDLFFRISVLVIEIPPLRERREDLPLLIAHFLGSLRERGVRHVEGVDQQALELLFDYPFAGNVRELENMLEGLAVALPSDRATIRAEDVRAWVRRRGAPAARHANDATHAELNLNDLEKWAISEALRQAHGNKSKAAQMLGISRDTLYRKLHGFGLDLEIPGSPT